MTAARFISLEGGEGCGKSTQLKLLAEAFKAAGIELITTREPGGEEGAEAIRKLLVEGDKDRWDATAETLLFLAARVQHVNRVIKPALARGAWVISDRFHDSTRVYQGIGKGVSERFYGMLHAACLGNFAPDLTFLLDIDPEKGLSRSLKRVNSETRFESMELSFHRQVREGFLAFALAEKERFEVVDAAETVANVHHRMVTALNARYGLALRPAAQ